MENLVYHVLHEGRRLGPFDRRTIVGMRVKKTLSSDSVLLGADGSRTTVRELVRQGQPDLPAAPQSDSPVSSGFGSSGQAPLSGSGGGSYSVIQGIHAAQLLEVEGKGYAIPPFKGELEVRVQTKVLRVSGRFREGLAWKEDRVKFPLQDIAHARLRGTVVDLWIRIGNPSGTQRVSLDLLTPEAAGELAESLPHTAPYPGSEPLAARPRGGAAAVHPLMWAGAAGGALAIAIALVWAIALRS